MIWDPVVFAYALVISGADLLVLAALAYLSNRLTKAIPLFLVIGISFFSPVLLGPLADLKQPQRAPLLFVIPNITPTPTHPGFSLIALYGILWVATFALGLAFLLIYFSFSMHVKSKDGGKLKPLFSILSLGVKDENTYRRLNPILKVIAAVLLVPALMWGIYPSILLLLQTWIFIWRSWALLPAIFFAEAFVTSTAATLFVYFMIRFGSFEENVLTPLLKIHGVACLSVSGLLALQLMMWNLWFDGSVVYESFGLVLPLIYVVIASMILSSFLALVSTRLHMLSIMVSIVALFGVLINKWNTIVNGQLASRTGLAVLDLHLPPNWLLTTMSPITAAIAIFVVLSWIFPLEVSKIAK